MPIIGSYRKVLSGTKVYCNDIDLLIEAKAGYSSLLVANHGSRIDWMVGMLVGFAKELGGKACQRVRIGFVCEALIQFMPIIGWNRKVVANDICCCR
jgi:1-acyl-sn-glycerol-3-phosphate acyltransferase